jgi:hypothetical protein
MDKRRPTDTLLLAILAVTVAMVFVQFALAGLGTFGQVHDGRVKDSDFAAHQTVGLVIALLTLLVLIAALIARPSRGSVITAAVLFVLAAPLQPLLGSLGADKAAWVGMLHVLNGVAILALSGNLLGRTIARRRAI